MEKRSTDRGWVLLASRDPVLVESVQASAVALDVELRTAADRGDLAAMWGDARLCLLGVELVDRVRGMGLPTSSCTVVGLGARGLVRASAELRVPAMELPGDADQLADLLAGAPTRGTRGRVIGVCGASGGLGASSLAVALAARAASAGRRAVVVELAECGGGLDLLLGLESRPGLRWDGLLRASGHLGDISQELPSAGPLSVLALSREVPGAPGAQAVTAVLGSLVRSFEVVVIDGGPEGLPMPEGSETLLLVGAHVRGVAAARMRLEAAPMPGARLVVRRFPGGAISGQDVGKALAAEVIGEVREDRRVPELAAAGLGLTRSTARRFSADTARLWDALA